MKTIIRKPTKAITSFQMICPNCGSIFQADKEDCAIQYNIDKIEIIGTSCPWCGNTYAYSRPYFTTLTREAIDYSKQTKIHYLNF